MKVLFITHYARLLGANRSLLNLIQGLRRQFQIKPLVLCPCEGPLTKALQEEAIPFEVLPFVHAAYTIRSPDLYRYPLLWRAYQRQLPLILKRVRAFKPDIIHSNSSVLCLGADLADKTGVPHVWHVREFGWADYQLIFPRGKSATQERMKKAAAVICISKKIRKAWGLQRASNTRVIFNGVATREKIHRQQPTTKKEGTLHVLAIGLLHPQKGQEDAIRAMDLLQSTPGDVHLTIAGTGRKDYALKLKWLTWLKGLRDQVSFTGFVSRPDRLYAAADVVLMTSRNEAMGRVTAEAMAHGVPVIGLDAGATPELINPGENGLLYKDVSELAEQIQLLQENPVLHQDMCEAAHQTALDRFTEERYTQRVFEVLQLVRR
jgi:glycosyltransferase involved in cell wall biosynthesis